MSLCIPVSLKAQHFRENIYSTLCLMVLCALLSSRIRIRIHIRIRLYDTFSFTISLIVLQLVTQIMCQIAHHRCVGSKSETHSIVTEKRTVLPNEWTNERTHDGTNIVMECREHGYHVGNKSVYSSFLLSLFQQIIFCLLFDITSCIVCIRFGMWPSWAHCSNNQNRSIHFSNMITREFARIYVYILYVIPIFFGKILVHQLNVSMRN